MTQLAPTPRSSDSAAGSLYISIVCSYKELLLGYLFTS